MSNPPGRSRRWLRVLLPIVVLAASGAGFAGLMATREKPAPVTVEEKAWLVQVQPVQLSSARPTLLLYGRVESPRVVRLRAAVNADVVEVKVAEGNRVRSGQALVALDDRDLQLVLRQRVAELAEIDAQIDSEHTRHEGDMAGLEHEERLSELAQRVVDRAADLRRRKLGSQAQIDQALDALERQGLALVARRQSLRDHEARLASLEARRVRAAALRDQALLDVERSRVKAPFDGRVTGVDVTPGDRVRSGDALLELFDLAAVEVRAQIPTRYVAAVVGGLEAGRSLRAEANLDGHVLTLTLDRFAARVGQGSGGVDALFKVHGDEARTMGRVFPLVLRLPEVEGVVEVPFEAVYGLDRVYRLEEERMRAVEVERVGEKRASDGRVSVLVRSLELQDGDRVIVTQLPNAITGLRVRVADGT